MARPTHKAFPPREFDLSQLPKSRPGKLKPMLATLTDKVIDRPGWFYELKLDGYRAIAELAQGKVELYSRYGQAFNVRYPEVVESLQEMNLQAVLDGEIIAFDARERPNFQLLQNYPKERKGRLFYYVFDILALQGRDLTGLPLSRRKTILARVVPAKPFAKVLDYIEQEGRRFFQLVKGRHLEGIIAKNGAGQYHPGTRTADWLKIKVHKQQEVVIGGFTEPKASREYIGALLLGVYVKGKLHYIGKVGTGFSRQSLQALKARLTPLITQISPFADRQKFPQATWVKPQLVCQIKFQEKTRDGLVRQAVFLGLREDKPPKAVVWE
jgi:bifunctional non-homologous end joining protein LigD